MGTTVEKLNKVLQTKEAIRTAINSKGGTLTESDTFSSYATAIDNIQTGSGENPMQEYVNNNGGDGVPSCYRLFFSYKGTSLDSILKSLDLSKVTDMRYMFAACSNLTTIHQLDTSNITDMTSMFDGCITLTSLPLLNTDKVTKMRRTFSGNGFYMKIKEFKLTDTSKVEDWRNTFDYNSEIESIKVNTDGATDMQGMFSICEKLEKIDITKLVSNGSNNENFWVAGHCYSLKTFVIRTMDTIPTLSSNAFANCYHFYGTTNANYNPEGLKDGAIYVPDDKVDALKVATNWSIFADIIKPLSTYVEE